MEIATSSLLAMTILRARALPSEIARNTGVILNGIHLFIEK
jgi:hypothetical protein